MQRNSAARPRYYPVMLDLDGRHCLVVGGGSVAERKVDTLLQSGAAVTVASPACTPHLSSLAESGKITWKKGEFEPADIGDARIVIAATNSPEVNRAVFEAASLADCLVNVADNPDQCNFIVPSLVQRGDLLIAVSTSGASPALAKKVRRELETVFGEEYTLFLEMLAGMRKRALAEIPQEKTRQEIFRRLADSEMLSLLRQGKRKEAERVAEEIFDSGRRQDRP